MIQSKKTKHDKHSKFITNKNTESRAEKKCVGTEEALERERSLGKL